MSPPWMEAFEPLQVPPPVPWWPPAPGWWLLGALAVAATWWAARQWHRHRQRNRYRRALQTELERVWGRHRPDLHPAAVGAYLAECCAALRRAWLVLAPERAALPSRELLGLLEETPGVTLPPVLLRDIEPLLYARHREQTPREGLELSAFHHQLLHWSRHHRREPPC